MVDFFINWAYNKNRPRANVTCLKQSNHWLGFTATCKALLQNSRYPLAKGGYFFVLSDAALRPARYDKIIPSAVNKN
jgi:hypothetical protein